MGRVSKDINPKQEGRKKKKVHPEAFQKYKAPLILLPNWCLCSVKAI